VGTKALRTERFGSIAMITLGRTDLDEQYGMVLEHELSATCSELEEDSAARVIVLTGSNRVFATGMAGPSRDGAVWRLASILANVRKPTIAAIDGDCFDQGLEMALGCDLRFASRHSRFGLTHISKGYLPWDGGTQRLPRSVGRANALRLLLTGDIIGIDEALNIGLVQDIIEGADFIRRVLDRSKTLVSGAPIAARYAKEAILAGADLTLDQGLRLEADLSIFLHTTQDRSQGIRGFRDHRPPNYEGK
jgi:enoyl-CoA hydratase/carnithine racemase